MRLDEQTRWDFPILQRIVNGHPLVYLDNAATSQKPQSVIDAMTRYYLEENSNIHRGVHFLSDKATQSYEAARKKIQLFINAASLQEIIYVRGTTEAINLVAHSYARPLLRPGDEVVVSILEHHSNFVPWKMACEATGAVLRVVPMTDAGDLRMDEYERLLGDRTRLGTSVAVGAVGLAGRVRRVAGVGGRASGCAPAGDRHDGRRSRREAQRRRRDAGTARHGGQRRSRHACQARAAHSGRRRIGGSDDLRERQP